MKFVILKLKKLSTDRDFAIIINSLTAGASIVMLTLVFTGHAPFQYREKIENMQNMQNVSMIEYIKTNNIVCGRCGGTNTIGFNKKR